MNVSDKQTAVPQFKYMVSGDSISKGVVYDEARSKYVILEENYVSLLQGNLKERCAIRPDSATLCSRASAI